MLIKVNTQKRLSNKRKIRIKILTVKSKKERKYKILIYGFTEAAINRWPVKKVLLKVLLGKNLLKNTREGIHF